MTISEFLDFSNGACAVYHAKDLLKDKYLKLTVDRDIIRTVYICLGYGPGRPWGRTFIKKFIDHLFGYHLRDTRTPPRSFHDVNVVFVAAKRSMGWGIMSDLSHGLHGIPGIRIIWHLIRLPLYDHDRIRTSYVELDDIDPLFPDRDDPSLYDPEILASAPIEILRIVPMEYRVGCC
jgi:hypothetical protein